MNTLHIDSITKSFGSRKILQDIYLSCKTGKIVGILGPAGGGKSTLLQIIFGTVKGDTQFIKYNNTVLHNQFDRKNKIAYLPQRDSFLPKNSKIKDLIPLFCNTENSKKLSHLELIKPFLHETSKNLSGGERRIVEGLIIILSNSDFIILDEPFNGISPKVVDEIEKIIIEESKQKGIIISDHNYEQVVTMADDIYLLSNTHLKLIKDNRELELFGYLPKSI